MRRKWFFVLIIVFAIVITVVIIMLSNPLRRSVERITADMLELTPIGTSMEDVLKIIEDRDRWEIGFISYEFGFVRDVFPEPRRTVGEKSISVNIGRYGVVIDTIVVDVFWGFNEYSELIDIWVRKVGLRPFLF